MATTEVRERPDLPVGLHASTLCEAFQMTSSAHPDRTALRTKGGETEFTWGDYANRVRQIAGGLASLGLKKGDTMALMLTNRPEFHFADTAGMHVGATPFSVYNTYAPEQIEYLVGDAECRILVTEQAFLPGILEVQKACSVLEHVIVVDGEAPEGVLTLDEVAGRDDGGFDFESSWRSVKPEDKLTLIYTSGTTGPPKGVQLTHDNLVQAVRSFDQIIPFPNNGRVVSYLPMAHVAERNVSQYLPLMLGLTVTCCPNPREVIGYLPEVRPTWFFAVPRIFEKLKAALEAGIEAEQDEERKKATKWALDVALQKVRLEQAGEPVPPELAEQHAKADAEVLSKIRGLLGLDELESLNVGAAPTPREVIEFYHALGLPLAELWGMSETCGAGTCNPREKIKIGTVGPPAPGIEIKIAPEDGGPDPRSGDHGRLPQRSGEDRRDDRLRRLAAHRRRGGDRRGRLPQDRRPQEGADHQRGRQEHVAREHRGQGEGVEPADRSGGSDRRWAPLQRRAHHARPGRRAGLRAAARDRGRVVRVAVEERRGARGGPAGG